jgi:tetratricopeptide repeat protein 21B
MAKYITELGCQQMLLGEIPQAEKSFHEAVSKDETDVRALYGIIQCRVQEGNLTDAEEQLEFLSEIQVSVGKSPDLAFLQSLLAWRKRRDVDGALNLLNETLTLHITAFKAAVGYDFFIKLNADFMLQIAQEYLQHTINTTSSEGAKPGGYLLRGVQVLETLTRFVPGLVPAQVLLAKAKVALDEVDVATRILHQCLRLDPSCSDSYLLLARIHHGKDQPNQALQYLEQGLSHDFSVRNHPLYALVKAQVLSSAGEVEPAVKVLEAAMELPGVKSVSSNDTKQTQSNKMVMLSIADRASIFTLLVGLLTKLKRLDEANEIVQLAIGEFADTSEQVKVLVANSQLAIEKGDIDQAINMLRSKARSSPIRSRQGSPGRHLSEAPEGQEGVRAVLQADRGSAGYRPELLDPRGCAARNPGAGGRDQSFQPGHGNRQGQGRPPFGAEDREGDDADARLRPGDQVLPRRVAEAPATTGAASGSGQALRPAAALGGCHQGAGGGAFVGR